MMTNFSEKGHAKNVANLGTMITFATGFGTGYNPSKQTISLAALSTLKEEAEKNLTLVNTHYTNWTVAVEAQQAMFARLNVHLIRIVNAVENCEVPPAVLSTAKALNKKLQGAKSGKAKEPVLSAGEITLDAETKSHSTSRQSQDSRNKTFYHAESGLIKRSGDVKKYVKSVYGATSPEFKQVSGLSFTRLRH